VPDEVDWTHPAVVGTEGTRAANRKRHCELFSLE
jgi:hypothetical protein